MVRSISVICLGKLGASMAACFAARGFRVEAADLNSKKVEAINRGVASVREPGLKELIRKAGEHLDGVDGVRYVRLGIGDAAERRVKVASSAR